MKLKITLISIMIAFAIPGAASNCPDLYPNSKPVVIRNTIELCNSFFVTAFDKTHNRAILVSERLIRGTTVGAAERINDFHSDKRVGSSPSPSQYTHSGFDRGHMAPAGDASNSIEMDETFLMTNMTPQEPTLNRIEWKVLEENTRKVFQKSKTDMYIMNVAEYADNRKMGSIPVPTGYWKIITVDGSTKYYYAPNTDHGKVVQKSAKDFTAIPK